MGFFHAEAKKERKEKTISIRALQNMPVEAMADMGCRVCPKLAKTPEDAAQLTPVGHAHPDVYFLLSAPDMDDGFMDFERGRPDDKALRAIYKRVPARFRARVGGITQCGSETVDVDPVAVSCCKNRVVEDIEESQPRLIITIGDAPLKWALPDMSDKGFTALTFAGTSVVTRIGQHMCYVVPVLYPNFVFKEKGDSAYEAWFNHQIDTALEQLEGGSFDYPEDTLAREDEYDTGIEYITGNENGDLQRLQRCLNALAVEPEVGVDIETNSLRVFTHPDPRIWMCAVSNGYETVVFALDHPKGWGSEYERRQAWSIVGDFLLHSGRKIAHNLSMEGEWFNHFYGPDILRLTEWGDTMAGAHILDGRPGTKSLGTQTRIYFGFNVKLQSNIDTKRIVDYPLLGKSGSMRYNGMDAKWTMRLRRAQMEKLANDPKFLEQLATKERLATTLTLTESIGMFADRAVAADFSKEFAAKIKEVDRKILATSDIAKYEREFGRGSFSPSNDDHVLKLLRDVLKRPECRVEDKKTGKVSYTSGEEVLSRISPRDMPSAALILEGRGLRKLKSTYVDPVAEGGLISEVDGMVHGKYSSMTAVTNRLACEEPNLQNWPKRKHREIRRIITARRSRQWKLKKIRKLVAVDFGQIEFRVAGMCSGDEELIKACWTKYDVHMDWAKRVLKMHPEIKDWILEEFKEEFKQGDWDEPNKSGKSTGMALLRQEMKNKWVFPSLFGAGVYSRGENLHLPKEVAQDLDGDFWDVFRDTKKWQEDLLRFWSKHLYVETLGGFQRRGAMSPNEVINMPIQGTACEIVVEAMIGVSELAYATDNWDLHPILNVHDDLTYDMEEDTMPENISIVAREMCKPRHSFVNVPLVVEVSVGDNWADLKGVAEYNSMEVYNLRNPYA